MKLIIITFLLGFWGGKIYLFFEKKSKDKKRTQIVKRSNVIQYDEMGYPLRLVITDNHDQCWIDTYEKEGDIVLKWEEK